MTLIREEEDQLDDELEIAMVSPKGKVPGSTGGTWPLPCLPFSLARAPPSLLPMCTVQEKHSGVDGSSENVGCEVLPPLAVVMCRVAEMQGDSLTTMALQMPMQDLQAQLYYTLPCPP